MTDREPLRSDLEALPDRLTRLPIHRGYPVPWFVAWVGHDADGETVELPRGQGEPDFRIMSPDRFREARRGQCWICGLRLGAHRTFNVGPMCLVNRTSVEPPSHRDCAEWSARNCPFLARPHMRRREAGMPEEAGQSAGIMLTRNPGVTLVWTTKRPQEFSDGQGGILFNIGEPINYSWWCQGRPATRAEVEASMDSGIGELSKLAEEDGLGAVRELEERLAVAQQYLPAP